jgi:hypothetical protein
MTEQTFLTEFQYKALQHLPVDRVHATTATEFAESMWPDSPGWKRRSKCGTRNVAVVGAAMPRMAGSHLERLRLAGLVERVWGEAPAYQPRFYVTPLGCRLLGAESDRRMATQAEANSAVPPPGSVSWIHEYGLSQKLSACVRCF